METLVRTPQQVFVQPQRVIVPLFQRPYVWNQENQWEPLWSDIARVAERRLNRPTEKAQPHFLGAVVLQQLQRPTGRMQERTFIDGQQRLTTLQLFLDALHAELVAVEQHSAASRIELLVVNPAPFCTRPEDRFKVWPTNRDRPAFNAVMAAEPPVDHDSIGYRGERLVEAHRFFGLQAREWLSLRGAGEVATRAEAIDAAVRDDLQMVVIDLAADENAQEIFETLNARGVQLTAADLIKNFIFQRLLDAGQDVEEAYQRNWKNFETAFWETEVGAGRIRYSRASIFLNHWLIARTGDEVLAREVFSRFKAFADFESGLSMNELLAQAQRAAGVYRTFVTRAADLKGPIDRLGLFGYRAGVLESEVIKPLILWLLDPDQPVIPGDQIGKSLDAIESWMVRRMLVRATTKNYNQVVPDIIKHLKSSDRAMAGDTIRAYLASQKSASRYWPDDEEIRTELRSLLAYKRLGRGRLRMVLEALEDHHRGWRDGKGGLGGERVARGQFAIEHVMPRKWSAHWKPGPGFRDEADRDRLIHTLGNLTLLMGKLNTKVSNGPWLGRKGKYQGLEEHDVLFLNRELRRKNAEAWTDEAIRSRNDELATLIIEIWPVPPGHRSNFAHEKAGPRHKVTLSDLINAGWLQPGMTLFPRKAKYPDKVATLLSDGQIDVDGTAYSKLSAAAAVIAGKPRNGMWFFLVSQSPRRCLRDVWREYVDTLAVEAEEDDGVDEAEDEDA